MVGLNMRPQRQFDFSQTVWFVSIFTVVAYALVISPNKQEIRQGENATLECQVNSSDECFWQLKDRALITKNLTDYKLSNNIEKGICSLTITNVSIERDDGNWSCWIPNQLNAPISNVARLIVIVPPSMPYVIYKGYKVKNNSELKVPSSNGQKLTFTCETRHGNPASNIYWQMGENNQISGNLTKTNETDSKTLKRTMNIIVLPIDFKLNAQNLTCISEHLFNETNKFIMKLNIAYATNTVKIVSDHFLSVEEGDDINFDCEANGNPPPKFEWRFKANEENEWQVISNKASFRKIALKTEEGKYLCLAGNIDPMLWSKEMTIKVTGKLVANLATVPLVFCAISVVILFTIILVTGLKQRQKKKYLEKKNANPSAGFTMPSFPDRKKIREKSSNVTNKKGSRQNRKSMDSYGYLVTKRPLPPILEVDGDQYVGFDPAIDKSSISSPENRKEVNLYEDPHTYENSNLRRQQISTIC